jgi:preprotein translocase subunit SecA
VFNPLPDAELRARALRLRGRARGHEPARRLLPEAFGLVAVAARRILGLCPFDVQLAAGVVLHHGGLAELATGEGKTLVATFPVYLNALVGKGAHVATVNDYLARRDGEWTRPLYEALGLSVGILQAKMDDAERVRAYRCDVTYGTSSEFGFDFLRDRLKTITARAQADPFWAPWRADAPLGDRPGGAPVLEVQRGHFFALVDEADSVFLDEARTPLVLGSAIRPATEEEQVVYLWADRVARGLVDGVDFVYDPKKAKVRLSDQGKGKVRWSQPPCGPHAEAMDRLCEHVERAVHAHRRYRRDQHYIVERGKVVIVDENTGRGQPDRHWQQGLHQAVEAKEGVPITKGAEYTAQVTFQSYFRLYDRLGGMTGTASQDWLELRRVYKLWVVCVPTNRPVLRQQWPDRVFPTEDAKFDAVVAEVRRLQAEGRPVLVGTRSVDKSEELSRRLGRAGIAHQVLNARQNAEEAAVVARAGERGQVTLATNMAGRGTDIKLGEGVAALGGLHVLGTERHESRRVDRQLAGRAGRQGDPGSCQFFLSLEDELLAALGPRRRRALRRLGRRGGAREWQRYRGLFLRAQRRAERKHAGERVQLLLYERHRREVLSDLSADPYVQ